MKQEPKLAIRMEKQLGWACKFSGMECLGISRAGQIVLAKLMKSQIQHPLCGSVGERFRKGTVASAYLSVWKKSVPELSP